MVIYPDSVQYQKDSLKKRIADIVEKFEKKKGLLKFSKATDPLDGLVLTLLSHNTNDRNRDIAWENLRRSYIDWEKVHHAPKEKLAGVIRVAGLHNQKAQRIQALLAYLLETEKDYKADFLKKMSFDEALERLGHLKGVGLKTLSVVMAFNIGIDIFPVDTHVHRLCRRLGFVPDKYSADKTFNEMRTIIPTGKSYQFHLHLIDHGRKICSARKPDCDNCFLTEECLYYSSLERDK